MAEFKQHELDFSRRNERRWIIEKTQALRGLWIEEGGRRRSVQGSHAKMVLLIIESFGNECWASVDAIVERSLVSRRETFRVLRALENAGILGREKERSRGQWPTNVYVIDFTALLLDGRESGIGFQPVEHPAARNDRLEAYPTNDRLEAYPTTECPPSAHHVPTECPPSAHWAHKPENLITNTKTAAVLGAAVEERSISDPERLSIEHDREPAVDIERVRSHANRIRSAMPSDRIREENRETIWHIAWLAERFGQPYIVDDLLRRVRRNTIEHYRSYLAGIPRHVCRDHGLDWLSMRSRCPPPTEAASRGSSVES